jgi:hypothetical protein
MIYYRIFDKSNMTGASSRAGTVSYPSGSTEFPLFLLVWYAAGILLHVNGKFTIGKL